MNYRSRQVYPTWSVLSMMWILPNLLANEVIDSKVKVSPTDNLKMLSKVTITAAFSLHPCLALNCSVPQSLPLDDPRGGFFHKGLRERTMMVYRTKDTRYS